MLTAKPTSKEAQRSLQSARLSVYPEYREGKTSYQKKNYEVVAGVYPKSDNDEILIVDRDKLTNKNALKNLGARVKNGEKKKFGDIVGTKLKAIANDHY